MNNTMNTSRRCAVITGASNGIGAAIAERLAQDGFAIIVNYATDESAANQVVAAAVAAGAKAIAIKANVASAADVRALFDAAEREFGGIDVLVVNAGVMKLAPIVNADDELFERQVDVNFRGAFNCLREGGRRVREGGRIVTLSSSVVEMCQPAYGVYAATKAAVEVLTRVLAKELRGRSVTANAIAPGPTRTKLFMEGKSRELIDQIASLAPLERLGEPADIAAVVSFLAGPGGGWINGQIIRANGGAI